MAGLAGEYDVVLVARSDGALAADIRPLVRVSVTVIAEQNGRREIGSGGGGGRFDYRPISTMPCCRNTSTRPCTPALINLGCAPGAGRRDDRGAWPGLARHPAA